jgi:hypothetical protein
MTWLPSLTTRQTCLRHGITKTSCPLRCGRN